MTNIFPIHLFSNLGQELDDAYVDSSNGIETIQAFGAQHLLFSIMEWGDFQNNTVVIGQLYIKYNMEKGNNFKML